MRVSSERLHLYLCIAGVLILSALLMVACSSGDTGSANATTPAGSGTTVASGTGTPGQSSSTTPTLSTSSSGGGQAGSAEFCANPPNIKVAVPVSIPIYPNAQKRVSTLTDGNGLFVFCSADATSTVLSFYLAQLPAKGWQNIQHNTIVSVEQLTASNGNGYILMTIQPDPVLSNTTEIAMETRGIS